MLRVLQTFQILKIVTLVLLPSLLRLSHFMEKFMETLSPSLDSVMAEEIGKTMVAQTIAQKQSEESKKKPTSKISMDKYDWSRLEFSNPRDPRTISKPCEGNHQVESFGKGSMTGCNGHGLWLVCARCRLRVLYVPTFGAKGAYRSAGPLPQDIVSKLKEDSMPEPSALTTQALSFDAAEMSAKKVLEQIQSQKAKVKAKAAPKPIAEPQVNSQASTVVVPLAKKATKRNNEKIPEQQEVPETEGFVEVVGQS